MVQEKGKALKTTKTLTRNFSAVSREALFAQRLLWQRPDSRLADHHWQVQDNGVSSSASVAFHPRKGKAERRKTSPVGSRAKPMCSTSKLMHQSLSGDYIVHLEALGDLSVMTAPE